MIYSDKRSGGRMGKGTATERAIKALEDAGFEKGYTSSLIQTAWYGRPKDNLEEHIKKAIENVINRANFGICDPPPKLKDIIDESRPCLCSKHSDLGNKIYVCFDFEGVLVL